MTTINRGCAPRPTNDYSEKILITWTTHLKNKQGEDIQAKKTSTKNKGSSFKKKYNILITEAGVLKSKYIKHRHQVKKYQYQDCLQSS